MTKPARFTVLTAFALVTLFGTFASVDGAAAQGRAARGTDTGVAQSLHPVRRERGLNCLADHFHVGNGAGQRTKKAAEVAAIRDWASFTAWEYGTMWANYGVAGTKTMSCDPSGSSWSCSVSARPCRR